MSRLFSPLIIRGETIPNRVFVSPMCQYSCEDMNGNFSPWHVVHLGSRAVGGAGLVMAEATAVQPEGRISPWDTGIWSDDQIEPLNRVVEAISTNGSIPAIQLAHAGRKASHDRPWNGGGFLDPSHSGWQPVGVSPIPFNEDSAIPTELTGEQISVVISDFADAAKRSVKAGMKVIELHMAHGYLGCSFLSPLSNKRLDKYGGGVENRSRCWLEVSQAVRSVIPESMPLFVRVSATEYIQGGWDLDECVQFCEWLGNEGVDLIDCSSGGNSSVQKLNPYPGYQVGFSERIKDLTNLLTGAVGLITEPVQAENILAESKADAILLARELLRTPYWPIHAREELDGEIGWPSQYLRGRELQQLLGRG